jgi:hypothetical protein
VGAVRTRRALVAFQIAMACLLLASTGLLLRSFERVLAVDPGFRAEDALRFDLYLPGTRFLRSWSSRHSRTTRSAIRASVFAAVAAAACYWPARSASRVDAVRVVRGE